jgi:hypothetical protein
MRGRDEGDTDKRDTDKRGRDKRDTVCLIFITPIILKRFEDVMAREEEKKRKAGY